MTVTIDHHAVNLFDLADLSLLLDEPTDDVPGAPGDFNRLMEGFWYLPQVSIGQMYPPSAIALSKASINAAEQHSMRGFVGEATGIAFARRDGIATVEWLAPSSSAPRLSRVRSDSRRSWHCSMAGGRRVRAVGRTRDPAPHRRRAPLDHAIRAQAARSRAPRRTRGDPRLPAPGRSSAVRVEPAGMALHRRGPEAAQPGDRSLRASLHRHYAAFRSAAGRLFQGDDARRTTQQRVQSSCRPPRGARPRGARLVISCFTGRVARHVERQPGRDVGLGDPSSHELHSRGSVPWLWHLAGHRCTSPTSARRRRSSAALTNSQSGGPDPGRVLEGHGLPAGEAPTTGRHRALERLVRGLSRR